jgi:hypothetical protein
MGRGVRGSEGLCASGKRDVVEMQTTERSVAEANHPVEVLCTRERRIFEAARRVRKECIGFEFGNRPLWKATGECCLGRW